MIPESSAVLLFLCVVAAVYILAAGALLRIVLRRMGRGSKPAPSRFWIERTVLVFAVAGLLCFAYGYFVEPYWPEVTRVRVESGKLAGASRPLRIAHISDLHCDPQPRLEERLPDIIAAEHPDLIVFTGDSINTPDGLPVLKPLLTRLAQIAPTYAVKGNWDTGFWAGRDLFGGTGVKELNAEALKVDVAGVPIWIAGAPYGKAGKIGDILEGVPTGAFTIFLYHTPDAILDVAQLKKVDLYCAGHTHGGQVALPLYGALVTLSKFGKRYEAGLYREGETWLYVNRGIGMEGGSAPRVRFWSRPEVTIIELTAAAEARP
ncbi:MAG: metallophosphoesterase [Acidobacteria bacterium]|nr:metallophosphoesterase [Acidobacteriota bacterium]